MVSNSDLTPVQGAGTTGNPQSVDGDVGSSEASSFQNSAGVETLSQNRPISVVQTGQPVKGTAITGGSLVLMWVFIVVASIVLLMIASSVFKWVMKKPETPKKEKTKLKAEDSKSEPKLPKAEIIRPQSKKKVSRSGRKKK